MYWRAEKNSSNKQNGNNKQISTTIKTKQKSKQTA